MEDSVGCSELDSDIEICIVDDDDDGDKVLNKIVENDDDDDNEGKNAAKESKNYDNEGMMNSPVSDIKTEEADDDFVTDQLFPEALPSDCNVNHSVQAIATDQINTNNTENGTRSDIVESEIDDSSCNGVASSCEGVARTCDSVNSCNDMGNSCDGFTRNFGVASSCNGIGGNNESDSDSISSDDEEFYDVQDDVFKRFYFESDHLAFKHNRDYKNLLRILILLEAERIQSVRDLEELQIWKEKALKGPISFVESLRSKNPPKLPERKQIPAIPSIDWMQYLTSPDMVNFANNFKVKTRRSFRTKGEGEKKEETVKTENRTEEENTSLTFDSAEDQGRLIRGRLMDENKTVTFNRLWTTEEQEKLEKLLQIYPPEEVEARRWEKIARALGNRTPKQVSSRVQKYFIKLARAGLPIPGRVPHLTTQRKSKINPVSYRNSTFFPSWKPSIYMNDDDKDETSSMTTVQSDDTSYISDEEMLPADVKESAEYKELLSLKRFKKEFEEGKTQCSACGTQPIKGPKYTCSDCTDNQPYHLCGQCFESHKQGSSGHHPAWHQIALDEKTSYIDDDYVSFKLQQGLYNYLDPNFTPSVR